MFRAASGILLREEHLEAIGLDRDEIHLILNEFSAILWPIAPIFGDVSCCLAG
jgi:hypothetical protein